MNKRVLYVSGCITIFATQAMGQLECTADYIDCYGVRNQKKIQCESGQQCCKIIYKKRGSEGQPDCIHDVTIRCQKGGGADCTSEVVID